MIFPRLWHRVLHRLEAGEAPTWLHESREALARRHLFTETARLEPTDRARRFVVELGPGAGQRYAVAFLRYLEEPGVKSPPLPFGLIEGQAAVIRTLLDSYVVRHRWRAVLLFALLPLVGCVDSVECGCRDGHPIFKSTSAAPNSIAQLMKECGIICRHDAAEVEIK